MSARQPQPQRLDKQPFSRTAKWCAAALVIIVVALIWRPWSARVEFEPRSNRYDVEPNISKFRDDLEVVLAEEPSNADHLRDALSRIDRETVMWMGRMTENSVLNLKSDLTAKLAAVSGPR